MATDHALDAYRDTLRRMYEIYPLKVMVDEIDRVFPGKLDDCVASAMRTFEDSVRWDSAESNDIPVFVVKKQTTTYCMTNEETREAIQSLLVKAKKGEFDKPSYITEYEVWCRFRELQEALIAAEARERVDDNLKSIDNNP